MKRHAESDLVLNTANATAMRYPQKTPKHLRIGPTTMLLQPSKIAATAALEVHTSTFLAELEQLTREDFTPSPYDCYTGAWLLFPLFFGTYESGLDSLFPINQAKCPATTEILRNIPGIITGGFSRMDAGTKIDTHTDLQPDNVVRLHLPLHASGDAELRFGEESYGWEFGKCLVFDGSSEHSTENRSDKPRVVLIADTTLDGDELAYLLSTREHR